MLTASLLIKKREGQSLTDDEIRFLVDGYVSGDVADYQMAAFAMAVCIRGMNPREIATLTRAMLESGDRLPRLDSSASRPRVDKHSTGGLGDKVSLILAPLLAACDVEVPMISGRGLGLTGGTLDKLESIEGFNTDLSVEESARILKSVGAFIVSASESIAPADRKLYALRDVTGTVESTALITASILSKKLAANLDALVMDVKIGSGAFMKTLEDATELAESLVRVGGQAGLPTTALITDMSQPLGRTIGNANEVNESIEVLRGGEGEVRDLTIELCAQLLVQASRTSSVDEAKLMLARALDSGKAMESFERMVSAQGGKLQYPLPVAAAQVIEAESDGYISDVNSQLIGETVVSLGGGRRKKGDRIDHAVGIEIHGRVGDKVSKGQPILTLQSHNHQSSEYVSALVGAITLGSSPVAPRKLVLSRAG